jgi:hypothetical protein
MSVGSAMLEAENPYKNQVIQATWGHLAPTKHVTYRGFFTFGVGCFESGSVRVLAFEFGDLDSSPWMYQKLHDFIFRHKESFGERGCVYQFVGTIRNYSFCGKITKVFDANVPVQPVPKPKPKKPVAIPPPSDNIEWIKAVEAVKAGAGYILETTTMFHYVNPKGKHAVCYWGSLDAKEAQTTLRTLATQAN